MPALSLLDRLLPRRDDARDLLPLYTSIVAAARAPAWYRDGAVPDTVDGRFDMVAAITSLVLLRLEQEDSAQTRSASARLTELFVDNMDSDLRQMGIGDLMVGKHVGKMMGALGGRLSALREAGNDDLAPIVRRNIFREAPPSEAAVTFVAGRLGAFRDALAGLPTSALYAGELPRP
jgi:cytochrome b pre-mRNA-processing protein 3